MFSPEMLSHFQAENPTFIQDIKDLLTSIIVPKKHASLVDHLVSSNILAKTFFKRVIDFIVDILKASLEYQNWLRWTWY